MSASVYLALAEPIPAPRHDPAELAHDLAEFPRMEAEEAVKAPRREAAVHLLLNPPTLVAIEGGRS